MHYFNYINALHGFSKNLRGHYLNLCPKLLLFFLPKIQKGGRIFEK